MEAEKELELAKKDRLVRMERAQAIRDENNLVSSSVTENYLKYRSLEVWEALAKSDNLILLPHDSPTVPFLSLGEAASRLKGTK